MTKGSSRLDMSERPTKFGMFYPRGYVIVSFRGEDDGERVRQELITGGYDEDDVQFMDTERVLKGSTADLEQLSPLIRALGSEPAYGGPPGGGSRGTDVPDCVCPI